MLRAGKSATKQWLHSVTSILRLFYCKKCQIDSYFVKLMPHNEKIVAKQLPNNCKTIMKLKEHIGETLVKWLQNSCKKSPIFSKINL